MKLCLIPRISFGRSLGVLAAAGVVITAGCSRPADSPPAVSLVSEFAAAEVAASPDVRLEFPRLEWQVEGQPLLRPKKDPDTTDGWSALNDISNLRVTDGLLQGRAGSLPVLTLAIPEDVLPNDRLWGLEVKLRISGGAKLGVDTFRREEIDTEDFLKDLRTTSLSTYMIDLRPGDDVATYLLTEANATFSKMEAIGSLRHISLTF
ncbi:MAG: hypothetical protein MUP13_04605, partial [Thermoanaerobaculales bacterium]|nr:hypothetical protein [Thermoanaerobaculales bacterium]